MRKNNIHLKGLKEGAEGHDLIQFLEEVFTACLGAGSEVVIQISSAFRVESKWEALKRPRDSVATFPNWQVKSKLSGLNQVWVLKGQ